MILVRPSGPRVALAVALAAATAALALTTAPSALVGLPTLLVAAALGVPFVEWSRVPAPLARVLPRIVALVLLVTALVAWLSRSVGALVIDPGFFPRVAGPVLLAAAFLFALAPRAFSVGRSLAPAIIGVLGVAGLDPAPEGYRGSALPFLRGTEHTAFAERYIALATVVLLCLWTSALLERGPRWSRRALATLALSLAVSAAFAAAGVIGLPLLQPGVERAFASTFAEGTTGLGGGSTLGEFAELAVSHRRVLDLQTSLPEGGEWRLPSEVFVGFDGRRWTNPPAPGRSGRLRPAATPPQASALLEGIGAWFEAAPAAAETTELRVTQAGVDSWPLLLPRGSLTVTAAAAVLEVDGFGLLRRPGGDPLRLYGALWSRRGVVGPPPPPEELEQALVLPPRIDPRLVALARELGDASPDPARRVETTLRHLQTGYRYTLAPGAFRSGDPLAEFLFEKKAGYCEYFASAAVVLLRLQGVPARFVKGLSVGPQTDQGGGLHVVRESDAHAWVEVALPGRGWIEVDPTPPGQLLASRPPASSLRRLVERLRAAWSSAWTRLTRTRARRAAAVARWRLRRGCSARRLQALHLAGAGGPAPGPLVAPGRARPPATCPSSPPGPLGRGGPGRVARARARARAALGCRGPPAPSGPRAPRARAPSRHPHRDAGAAGFGPRCRGSADHRGVLPCPLRRPAGVGCGGARGAEAARPLSGRSSRTLGLPRA